MIEGLDDLASKAMTEWQIPGLAIAVVQRDKPMLLGAYGLRDVEAGRPVTTDTHFAICSLTKSIVAAALGLLQQEGRLDWNDPVRRYVPEFRLHDPIASERVTVRDLLSHQSGLPRHDWIVDPGNWSGEQVMAAMAHLEPSKDIRSTFQYCNLGYVVAGIVLERITRMRWEDFVRERLTNKLNMAATFTTEALQAAPNAAVPYAMHGSERKRADYWPIPDSPAGGINMSIASLANWLALLLSRGVIYGTQLISPAVLDEMLVPRVYVRRSDYPEIGDVHYGLGLACQSYRGMRAALHDGSWIGWGTLMSMLPERGIGVAVLTNRDQSPVGSVLAHHVYDRLCGWEPIDWLERYGKELHESLERQRAERATREATRHPDTRPSRDLSDFAGSYEHPGYGRIEIACAGDALLWSYRGLSAPMRHWHFDTFALPESAGTLLPDSLPITFSTGRDGSISGLSAPLEPAVKDIVFLRVAASRS